MSEFRAVLNCPAVAEIAPLSVELISVTAAELGANARQVVEQNTGATDRVLAYLQ